MNLSLGFSPCPNDTFLFDAWVNGKLTDGPPVRTQLADVQTLNEQASAGILDITKLSFPALFQNLSTYRLLRAGSALGNGVGPLLISKKPLDPNDDTIDSSKILLPGRNTTANLLFSFAYPHAEQKSFRIFSEIEDGVLNGTYDLGVIIHENRFTYQQRGLHLVCDLGAYWEKQTGCAVPLGCIALKRNYSEEATQQITQTLQQSLQWAWDQLPHLSTYVTTHAQEMEETVMRQHIDLYVNQHTLNLSEKDVQAIQTLYQVYCQIEGKPGAGPALLF